MTRALCAACFERHHGEEPEMGCEVVSFAPGTCPCGFTGIVFTFNPIGA